MFRDVTHVTSYSAHFEVELQNKCAHKDGYSVDNRHVGISISSYPISSVRTRTDHCVLQQFENRNEYMELRSSGIISEKL